MKKSLITLAVLAASGTAFAQSSVTVYGLVDTYLARTDSTGAKSQTVLQSGGVNGSRWGLKGSEDLGGGLKANFQLEQGFGLDTGAASNSTGTPGTQTFDRQSWVGLSGNFGDVQLGKVWTAFDDIFGVSDALFDSDLAPMEQIFATLNYIDRPVNGVRYTSPEIAGFTGAVSYNVDEGNATVAKVSSFSLSYAAGPLAAQLGYQNENIVNTLASPKDTKYTLAGVSYDFGMVKALAQYGIAKNVGNAANFDAKEFQIGADVPVGPNLLLSVSYARSDDDLPAGNFEAKREGYAAGATYTLSKRTFLYGGYSYNSTSQNAARDVNASLLALGIQHRF